MSINISNNHKTNVSEYSDSSADAKIKSIALQEQLNKIHVEHHELSQANHAKYLQLIAIYSSTSWRLTAPLRFTATLFKRLNRVIALTLSVIDHEGGVINAVKKLSRLYLSEGVPGLKHGLRTIAFEKPPTPFSQTTPSNSINYEEWVRQFDTLTEVDRIKMCAIQADFTHKPTISVIMPTYNSRTEWLIEAIESVRRQIYPHWELCIADDASSDSGVLSILKRYAEIDSRIKVVFRAVNGHISAASNSALELATGEWVALLDHDDVMSENALFWVSRAINFDPTLKLIYSDEDKINETGERADPYFKCDWNKNLFYSHNLITHLGVYKTDIMRNIGGFRSEFNGAQDYDLALRFTEHIKTTEIYHIPRILYHWRTHVHSTAQSADAKPYAMIAGQKALNEHLTRININAIALLLDHGYRVKYKLPILQPLVSLIIPTRNGYELIKQCVDSILYKTDYSNYEIIIVDNGSDDRSTLEYFESLKYYSNIKILHDDRPFNYSQLNNFAASSAKGELIGLINNDIEVINPGWLTEMVSHAVRPEVGAVGASLWYPNNTSQHAGVILGVGGWAGHSHKGFHKGDMGYLGRLSLISSFSAVTGACLIVRKQLFVNVGGLNEKELSISCNDVDLCLRLLKAGYTNVWTPYAELYHHESATRGYEDTPEKIQRFASELNYMKIHWSSILFSDPAYSPNLTLDSQGFDLAFPPRLSKF